MRHSSSPISCNYSVGAAATLACIWEARAPKPGNVHPAASFDDLRYEDFHDSALAIGPVVARVHERGVGRTILDAVHATKEAVGTNTNLGSILLIVPLAAAADDTPLRAGIPQVLRQLTPQDTRYTYQAIRDASAGGLGQVDSADVNRDPPPDLSLVAAMRLAADRDLVARQYVTDFAEVFDGPVAWIEQGIRDGWALESAIAHAHLRQLALEPDSLIARKCGIEVAREASRRAAEVLASGQPNDYSYERATRAFDQWLRLDGHRRNPGTTADLIAAALFVLLREGRLAVPAPSTRQHTPIAGELHRA